MCSSVHSRSCVPALGGRADVAKCRVLSHQEKNQPAGRTVEMAGNGRFCHARKKNTRARPGRRWAGGVPKCPKMSHVEKNHSGSRCGGLATEVPSTREMSGF